MTRANARAQASAIAEATNINAKLSEDLLNHVMLSLGVQSLRACANVCKKWHALTRPLMTDCVKLMVAHVLTNATLREAERASDLPDFVISPRPQIEEAHLHAAAAALEKVRSARPDDHELKRPLHLELPTFSDPIFADGYAATNYMLGGSLRVGNGGMTERERAHRQNERSLHTACGNLNLTMNGLFDERPRTQLCCMDGKGVLFDWSTEIPHITAEPAEKRIICLAEMSKPREIEPTYDVRAPNISAFHADHKARNDAFREWYEQPPFTDATKVLAYDVLLCNAGRHGIRNDPSIFLPTPSHTLPKDITRLAVFSYPDLEPLTYFGDLRPHDGEHYVDRTSILRTEDFEGQDGEEGRSINRLEITSWHDPPEPRTMPGEDGLGIEIWDDRNYKQAPRYLQG